jgi:hypothetical protein
MSNSRMYTDFKVVGREYDGAQSILAKSFPMRMTNIVIQESLKKYGAEHTLIPTDVHFMPVYFDGDSTFKVRAWHETESPDGQVGVLQPYLGDFEVLVGETDGYLHCIQDDEQGLHYKLTTAEAIGLLSLANAAASHDIVTSLVNQAS